MTVKIDINDLGGDDLEILTEQELERVPVEVADSVKDLLRRHFIERGRTPNRLGGKRTNFWGNLAKGETIYSEVEGLTAIIGVSSPAFVHKVTGGTIRPKTARYLTIPVHPDAHGLSAREVESTRSIDLFFMLSSGGNPLLATEDGAGGITVYYVLRRSVTQDADPEALPPEEEIIAAAEDGAANFLAAFSDAA